MNLVERDLAARASRGDVRAFSRLVRDHADLVYRVAVRILGPEDAQDASQEVWVKVWRNIKGFRGESAFSTWLYKITVNTCLNARQRGLRRELRELPDELPHLPAPSGGEHDPEATTLSRERRAELLSALQELRAEHRVAVVLRHMEGLGYAEISDILDIPEGTAKGWAARGRAALLVALSSEDSEHRSEDGDGGAP